MRLPWYLIAQEDLAEARKIAWEGLALVRDEGGFIVRVCLQQWALLGALDGQSRMAAHLIGHVNAGFADAGEDRQPTEQQIYDRLMERLRITLASADIDEFGRQGAQWSEDEAVAFVLSEISIPLT